MVSNALSQHIESASMTMTFDFEHVHVGDIFLGEFMSTYNAAMVIKVTGTYVTNLPL